jgi:hypothetical protein
MVRRGSGVRVPASALAERSANRTLASRARSTRRARIPTMTPSMPWSFGSMETEDRARRRGISR